MIVWKAGKRRKVTIAKPYLVPILIPPLNSGYDVEVGNAYPHRCRMLIEGIVMEGSRGSGVGRAGDKAPLELKEAAAVAFSLSNCCNAFSLRSSFIFLRRSKLSSSRLNALTNP